MDNQEFPEVATAAALLEWTSGLRLLDLEILMGDDSLERWTATLESLVKNLPDNRNPKTPNDNCLYTSDQDPDLHCLLGQAMLEMGVAPPGPLVTVGISGLLLAAQVDVAMRHHGLQVTDLTEEQLCLADLLEDWQVMADRQLCGKGRTRISPPWGTLGE